MSSLCIPRARTALTSVRPGRRSAINSILQSCLPMQETQQPGEAGKRCFRKRGQERERIGGDSGARWVPRCWGKGTMKAAHRGSVAALVPASGAGRHMTLPRVCQSRTPMRTASEKSPGWTSAGDLRFQVEREDCRCLIHSLICSFIH